VLEPTTTATLTSPAKPSCGPPSTAAQNWDRLLSIAALLAAGQDDVQGAQADVAQVAVADGLLPRLARAAIADPARPASASDASELKQVIKDADLAELAGEPTLLNVLASLAVRHGDLDDAVRQFELAAAANPPYPAGRLQLASAPC
jgi:hypothetical protein